MHTYARMYSVRTCMYVYLCKALIILHTYILFLVLSQLKGVVDHEEHSDQEVEQSQENVSPQRAVTAMDQLQIMMSLGEKARH